MTQGTAERNGELWGARARDWAEQESQHLPIYEEAIRRAGIGAGTRVLDVGCGSGVFLRAAADHGATVSGLDASEALVELARARAREADIRAGDLQFPPYDDESFDVVTGFNSFQFAADTTAALREAGRVARTGGLVVIQVWGPPERCDLAAVPRALAPLRPPPPRGATGPSSFAAPGVLEAIAAAAGLTPTLTFDLVTAFEYPDEAAMLRSVLSSGAGVDAVRASGEDAVRAATVGALAPFRGSTGSYRLENEWHYVIASA